MGRVIDLFGEVAAAAEEGSEGLVLPPEDFERLRAEWEEEDIEDALGLVHESLLQGELVDAADSLSARLLEVLGAFGEAEPFGQAQAGEARISLEVLDHLARRVARLEEVLEVFRGGKPPERSGFDSLRRRLMDVGIENDMRSEAPPDEDEEE